MRRFKPYSIEDFEAFVEGLTLSRKITNIQTHHTWKPRKTDYKGERTIYGMWRHHTRNRKWQDIGQHFSVAPDGTIWDGRSLEIDPAGIKGNNEGGLMFEIIGNFDEEELEGKQLFSVTRAVALLLKKFDLTYDDIVFHREHDTKTCPGTGLKKAWFIEMVKRSGVKEIKPSVEFEGKEIASFIKDGRTYVQVRELAELLGLSIEWDNYTKTVKLKK